MKKIIYWSQYEYFIVKISINIKYNIFHTYLQYMYMCVFPLKITIIYSKIEVMSIKFQLSKIRAETWTTWNAETPT